MLFDKLIEAVSPKTAFARAQYRAALEAQRQVTSMASRRYGATARSRKREGVYPTGRSNNAELLPDLWYLRNKSRQMVRDNKYLDTGLRNLTVVIVGDGMTARAIHKNKAVARKAQDYWDGWAESKIYAGEHDFYTSQFLAVRNAIQDGDTLIGFEPYQGKPDARLRLMEGDYLDVSRNAIGATGNTIMGGVEYAPSLDRVAYWLFPALPGGLFLTFASQSERFDARNISHVYDPIWLNQVRGQPWFHAVIDPLEDIDDGDEAVRIKRKIAACLAVMRIPGTEAQLDPMSVDRANAKGISHETLSPGLIIEGRPGEDLKVINPPTTDDGDTLRREELMSCAASVGIPYSMFTGDVSQANYSSERSAWVSMRGRKIAWQAHMVVPKICDPAFERTMRRAAVELNDPRLLEVKAGWTPPPFLSVDPLKDVTAEIMAIRAGLDNMPNALTSRGFDPDRQVRDVAGWNAKIDAVGIVFDSDPRHANKAGGLQAPGAPLLDGDSEGAAGTKTAGRSPFSDFALAVATATHNRDRDALTRHETFVRTLEDIGDPRAELYGELFEHLTQD